MNTLQVEQLQEDIITIMESHFPNENVDEVISLLCDVSPIRSMIVMRTNLMNQVNQRDGIKGN